jgi:hypothetical protein
VTTQIYWDKKAEHMLRFFFDLLIKELRKKGGLFLRTIARASKQTMIAVVLLNRRGQS